MTELGASGLPRVPRIKVSWAVAGSASSFAVTTEGHVLAFGRNDRGQLGLSGRGDRLAPARVRGLAHVARLAIGPDHAAALLQDATLSIWGSGLAGGVAAAAGTSRPVASALPASTVSQIAAGEGRLLALTTSGRVWAIDTSLPDGSLVVTSPRELDLPHPVVEIATGAAHAVAITRDGGVWTFGANDAGQLGDGSREAAPSPVEIAEAGYDWKVGRPIFDPAGGELQGPQSVTLSSATPDALIHYTTDGQEPNASDPAIPSGEDLTIASSATVKAKAVNPPSPPSNTSRATFEVAPPRPGLEGLPKDPIEHGRGRDGSGRFRISELAVIGGETSGYGAVAGGPTHSLLVKPDGTVWAWVHIATNKSIRSGFTALFKKIFSKGGMSLEDAANKMILEGHKGVKHSPEYHRYVLDRLRRATQGLKGEDYVRALRTALEALRRELIDNPDLIRGCFPE